MVYAELIYTHGIILDSLLVKNKGTLSFANKKLKFEALKRLTSKSKYLSKEQSCY